MRCAEVVKYQTFECCFFFREFEESRQKFDEQQKAFDIQKQDHDKQQVDSEQYDKLVQGL